jgi:hypothetical protein
MNTCLVYLASPLAFQEPTQPGLTRLEVLKKSLISVSLYFSGLPVIIFHEDYAEAQFKFLSDVIPNIIFEKIDFHGGEEHFIRRKRDKNYLMMCRFFCGILQSHSLLQKYDSYIRMDDDSFFIPPPLANREVFQDYDYTYRSTFLENHDQSTLYHFTKSFMEKRHLPINTDHLHEIGFLKNNIYTGLAPYNNFHFAKLTFWQHPLIREYLNVLEEKHGILKYMWLDANIHAMLIWVIAPACGLKVSCISTFGYRHNRHFSIIGSDTISYQDGVGFCPNF